MDGKNLVPYILDIRNDDRAVVREMEQAKFGSICELRDCLDAIHDHRLGMIGRELTLPFLKRISSRIGAP